MPPRRSPAFLAAIALACVATTGCAHALGTFDDLGFHREGYRYSVLNGADGRILAQDWHLDNFQIDRDGTPQRPKVGDEYQTTYTLDVNGDGVNDRQQREFRYDLRFRHRRTAGVIWLRTFPVSSILQDTELRVLMRHYVEAVSGSGFVGARLGPVVVGIERRFATRTLEAQPFMLHGLEAYGATMEVANVDQLLLSPDSRSERARIVLVRTPFRYQPSSRGGSTFPVYMMAGYSNLPEDFDDGMAAFTRFLTAIDFLDAPPNTPHGATMPGGASRAPEPPEPVQPPPAYATPTLAPVAPGASNEESDGPSGLAPPRPPASPPAP